MGAKHSHLVLERYEQTIATSVKHVHINAEENRDQPNGRSTPCSHFPNPMTYNHHSEKICCDAVFPNMTPTMRSPLLSISTKVSSVVTSTSSSSLALVETLECSRSYVDFGAMVNWKITSLVCSLVKLNCFIERPGLQEWNDGVAPEKSAER